MIFIGIGLTGFGTAHWFLWLPTVMFAFAGITGVCPGLRFWRKMGFE